MSLTLSLTSRLKKQSPSPGTDPLPAPYSIILCIQHMYSTYVGYIWSRLRSPAMLSLFKGGKLKQAHFHISTWLSNTFLFEHELSCFPSSGGFACSYAFTSTYIDCMVKQVGKLWFWVYIHFGNWTVLFCQKIQLSLTSKMENFSDLSVLVMSRQDNLIFYFPERFLMCITLLIVNVNFLVAA